jgi:hypothetical protein
MVYAYNPNTWEIRQEDREFETSLDYIVMSFLKQNKTKMIFEGIPVMRFKAVP